MKIEPLDGERIEPPARGILQRYLALDPPTRFTTQELVEGGLASEKARHFASQAARSRVALRVERGEYVAVDPSIAIRAWALPEYYASVLLTHDALGHLGIEHAFACLTATEETELVLDRPWVVAPGASRERAGKVDRFLYDVERTSERTLEVMGERFQIPTTSPEETGLLLASAGLPREVEAAERLLEAHEPPEELVPAFNYFGLDLQADNLESRRPEIQLPDFIEERRERLSEELLRGGPS